MRQPPAGMGGQGTAAGDMAYGLEARGIDVEYVSPPPLGLARRLATKRPLRQFKSLGRELDRRAVAAARLTSVDLVYALPGFLPRGGFQGVRVLHQATHHPRRILAAVRQAQVAAGGGRGFMTRGEARRFEAELERADLARVESRAVATELIDEGLAPERVVVSYPGVDLDRFAPRERSASLRVAFVGVLSVWKGVDVLVRLADTLSPSAEIVVIGGPVCPWSRRLVSRAPLQHHEGDVPSLLGSSHALVLPSASDGFGYVVLEAMAAGAVPFVSPEVGAAELVRELDARLVQPRPVFAQRVSELLHTLPLEELGRNARRLAQRYERTVMAERAASQVLERIGHLSRSDTHA